MLIVTFERFMTSIDPWSWCKRGITSKWSVIIVQTCHGHNWSTIMMQRWKFRYQVWNAIVNTKCIRLKPTSYGIFRIRSHVSSLIAKGDKLTTFFVYFRGNMWTYMTPSSYFWVLTGVRKIFFRNVLRVTSVHANAVRIDHSGKLRRESTENIHSMTTAYL